MSTTTRLRAEPIFTLGRYFTDVIVEELVGPDWVPALSFRILAHDEEHAQAMAEVIMYGRTLMPFPEETK